MMKGTWKILEEELGWLPLAPAVAVTMIYLALAAFLPLGGAESSSSSSSRLERQKDKQGTTRNEAKKTPRGRATPSNTYDSPTMFLSSYSSGATQNSDAAAHENDSRTRAAVPSHQTSNISPLLSSQPALQPNRQTLEQIVAQARQNPSLLHANANDKSNWDGAAISGDLRQRRQNAPQEPGVGGSSSGAQNRRDIRHLAPSPETNYREPIKAASCPFALLQVNCAHNPMTFRHLLLAFWPAFAQRFLHYSVGISSWFVAHVLALPAFIHATVVCVGSEGRLPISQTDASSVATRW